MGDHSQRSGDGRRMIELLVLLLVVILVTGAEGSRPFGVSRLANRSTIKRLPSLQSPANVDHSLSQALILRGGSDNESESESEEEEEEEEGELLVVSMDAVLDVSKKALAMLGKLTVATLQMTSRAILAAFDEEEDAYEISVMTKVWRALGRMWKAAWQLEKADDEMVTVRFREERDGDDEVREVPTKKKKAANVHKSKSPDFGRFLESAYEVEATRDELHGVQPILGGSISDALKKARDQARLLVVFIPTSRPGKGKKNLDEEAIQGFLSAEVATVAEKRARKKEETGSYLLWSAKSGSAEAVAAVKRLKAAQTNSKGQKRPILLVAYPAQVVDGGMPRIVPRLLAQHHCSPPPSPEMMAAWLNALRKRHAKQYASMQLAVREEQLYRERQEGYHGSIQSDLERQERERREREARMAREKAEKERRQAIVDRRQQLRESLPAEPLAPNAKLIALRLADGRSSQRRFSPDTKLSTIFNWVDAEFELEREAVTLTTLNGQKSFSWEDTDQTLADIGFAKMTGLRVTVKREASAAS